MEIEIGLNSPISSKVETNHVCPNGDVTACEYCELINFFSIIIRNFKLRNLTQFASSVEECRSNVYDLRSYIDQLSPHLSRYDFDEKIKSNGYRTFVNLSSSGAKKCIYVAKEINEISRSGSSSTKLEELFEKLRDWSRIFRVVSVIMGCCVDFVNSDNSNSLFTSSAEALERLIKMSKERVNIVGFHGKLLAFQYHKSVRVPLRVISTLMAAYSEIYKLDGFFTSSVLSSKSFIYYWRNPSKRADRIAKICADNPLEFFKQFWLIQEKGLPKIFSSFLGETVESNVEILIPPTPLSVTSSKSNSTIKIKAPTEYIGPKPLRLRLISHKIHGGSVRSGHQIPTDGEKCSSRLIVHCHGGGFVAQSSASHLVYLKSFARGVGAPIVSIDYSLSPESPYPRSLHECLYAYIWCLQHTHLLGTTADRVILTGDSAGGLILAGVVLLCIELGLRLPDGLLLIYTPLLLESAISPARLLSLADPLIPYPALAACLTAYVGGNFDPNLAKLPGCFIEGGWEERSDDENSENIENSENCENCSRKYMSLVLEELENVNLPSDDFHLSPLLSPDYLLKKFPPTSLVSTSFDPCLDDCVEFAKRLKSLNVPTTLDVLDSLPHGFLNFGKISEECYQGIEICFERLKNFC